MPNSNRDPLQSYPRFSLIVRAVVRMSERGVYLPQIITASCLAPAAFIATLKGYPAYAVVLAWAAVGSTSAGGLIAAFKGRNHGSETKLANRADPDTT